jgi:hypothetical protein
MVDQWSNKKVKIPKMLILSEENKKLKGTKYRLPQKLVDRYRDIIINYSMYSNNGGFKKANNVLKKGGIISMEWLKNMKAFFEKHINESDIDFILAGGELVKYYVNTKLDQLTGGARAQHTNNPTKIRNNASNLSGNRGEKSSKSLNIASSLMSGLIPKFESKQHSKILIITEEQLKEINNKLKTK